MKLHYHQAIFDLLTQTPIDSTRYLQAIAEYEEMYRPSKQPTPPEWKTWTTFDLYQREPQISEPNIQLLDAFETRSGVTLPASMREWYSLDIGLPMLYVDDSWWATSLSKLGSSDWPGDTNHKQLLALNILPFISEQQSDDCCIRLDQGDDPPVYWLHESRKSSASELLDVSLIENSPRFSDFVFCYLWDWLVSYQSIYGFSIHTIPSVPVLRYKPEYRLSLDHISHQFKEIAQQLFGKKRFYNQSQRFSIWSDTFSDKSYDGSGGGEFYADSPEALCDLIQYLWGNNPPLHKMSGLNSESSQIIENLTIKLT